MRLGVKNIRGKFFVRLEIEHELKINPVCVFGGAPTSGGGLIDVIAGEEMGVATVELAPLFETPSSSEIYFMADVIIESRIFAVPIADAGGAALGVKKIFRVGEVETEEFGADG